MQTIKEGQIFPKSFIGIYKICSGNSTFNFSLVLRSLKTVVASYKDKKIGRCHKMINFKVQLFNKEFAKGANIKNRLFIRKAYFYSPVGETI